MLPSDQRDRELLRIVALERAKRIVVCGLVACVVLGGWLFFAWRASRIDATECTVQAVEGGAYCTVAHRTADGEEHTLPWESCDRAGRRPQVQVGTKVPCYVYRSFPSEMLFEPPRVVVWLTPARGVAFALALMSLGVGGVALFRARPRRRDDTPPVPGGAYRAPEPPPPSGPGPEPLLVPLKRSPGWLGWVFALPFVLFGTLLLGLSLTLAWQATGDVTAVPVVLITCAAAVPLGGLAGIGYRTGLVVDRHAGRISWWWGLFGSWFSTHHRLSSLAEVTVESVRHRRGTDRTIALRFANGRSRTFASDDDPEEVVSRVNAYLAGRPQRDPGRV